MLPIDFTMVTIALKDFNLATETAIENFNSLLIALFHECVLANSLVDLALLLTQMIDERTRQTST